MVKRNFTSFPRKRSLRRLKVFAMFFFNRYIVFSFSFLEEFAVAEIANSPPNNIIKVALEDPVNVTCTGSGNPKPRVQWLSLAKERSDVSYKPDDSNPSQAILYIAAVEEKHFGNYSCFAKSFLGESEVFLGETYS